VAAERGPCLPARRLSRRLGAGSFAKPAAPMPPTDTRSSGLGTTASPASTEAHGVARTTATRPAGETPTTDSGSCRSCGSDTLWEVLDLGMQPPANRLLRREQLDEAEFRWPLKLAVCQACWLLQITDLIPPSELFSDYPYFSSNSDEMLLHAERAASRYRDEFRLDADTLVAEIASNDGYLLKHFHAAGIPCLGIEPAANIAAITREMGIETLVEFFGRGLGEREAAAGRRADLILGNNVFAHAPDTNDFVAGIEAMLAPGGRAVIEFPYAADFILNGEFDTIYHEHVFYFGLTALRPLFERHGLEVFHVERLAIHGGSLRIFVGHAGDHPQRESVDELLALEGRLGMNGLEFYLGFGGRVERLKEELDSLLRGLRRSGRSIAAYGASAKGSTLLNYFGLGAEVLEFVVDRSPHKQGKLTPGTHLPILAPGELLERRPDYTLLLTWNFADEILAQQRAYREAGGRFIIPIPELRVV